MEKPITKNQANKAGERIAKESEPSSADLEIVEQWRAAHLPALNAAMDAIIQVIGDSSEWILVGRLKKLDTIVDKLQRKEGKGRHSLKKMGDIAGCRIIVPNLEDQDRVCDKLRGIPDFTNAHINDYVKEPKETGYRAIHMYPSYFGSLDNTPLSVEVQIRTFNQHMWATSVEIYDSVMRTRLKFGAGESLSEAMFKLLAAALNLKDTQHFFPEDTQKELDAIGRGVSKILSNVGMLSKLEAANDSLFVAPIPSCTSDDLVLLDVDLEEQVIEIVPLPKETAVDRYGELERDNRDHNVVLVSTADINDLKIAYPNYFMDAGGFVVLLNELLAGSHRLIEEG